MKKLIYVAVAGVMAAFGLSNCCSNGPAPKLNNDLDSLGYAYGIAIGQQYANFTDSGVVVPDVVMDPNNFIAGLAAAIRKDSAEMKMTTKEAQQFIQEFSQKIQVEVERRRFEEIEKNKAAGQEYMAKNAKEEGVITLESGLQIKHIEEGKGKSPEMSDEVKVAYKGTTINGKVFDENDDATFPLSRVVKGFSEALTNMKVGGSAIVTMPADLAYGDQGAGQDIPGGSTLIFELTLKEIVKK